MANPVFNYGLRLVGSRDHEGHGGVQAYFLASTEPSVGVGDIITKTTGLNANPILQFPRNTIPNALVLDAAAGTAAITGVIVGILPLNPFEVKMGDHGLTGKDRVILVQDSIEAEFSVRSAGNAVPSVGLNVDIAYTAPDANTGNSKVAIDSATAAKTATLPLKIVRILDTEYNDGSIKNAEYIVRINNSTEAPNTAGVGV